MVAVSQPVLVSIVPQRYAFLRASVRRIIAAYTAFLTNAKEARDLYEMRGQLSQLTDRQLDDIGLRRDQIKAIKPDWIHTPAN